MLRYIYLRESDTANAQVHIPERGVIRPMLRYIYLRERVIRPMLRYIYLRESDTANAQVHIPERERYGQCSGTYT